MEAKTVHSSTPKRCCVPSAVLLRGYDTGGQGVGDEIWSKKVPEFEGGKAEG